MNVSLYSTLLLLLLAAFISDRRVTGKCGDRSSIADTPWAACLVAEEGDVCPHNFKKLEDDDSGCATRGRRSPPYKKRVCCLLGPTFELKIKDAPCLEGKTKDEKDEEI